MNMLATNALPEKAQLDRVELIGDNCELGNFLVSNGYKGGSLFRFVFNPPESFLRSLRDDFKSLFLLENLTVLPWGMVEDHAYGMHFHTEILTRGNDEAFRLEKDDHAVIEKYQNEYGKYQHLKRRFASRAMSGSAVYIIKCNAGIDPDVLNDIESELARIAAGADFLLVEVRGGENGQKSGIVERISERRAVGWISDFSDYSDANNIRDPSGWADILKNSLALESVESSTSSHFA